MLRYLDTNTKFSRCPTFRITILDYYLFYLFVKFVCQIQNVKIGDRNWALLNFPHIDWGSCSLFSARLKRLIGPPSTWVEICLLTCQQNDTFKYKYFLGPHEIFQHPRKTPAVKKVISVGRERGGGDKHVLNSGHYVLSTTPKGSAR